MERLPETIDADGLLLRRWRVEDAEALGRAIEENLEHLRPWMGWIAQEPLQVAARRDLIAEWEREWEAGGDSIIGVFREGAVLGSCGLHRRHGPSTLDIGYWIRVDFLRQGIATRVAATLTETALAVPGIDRVEIHHDRANERSAAVPRKLGYTFGGETPDEPEAPAEIGIDCTWWTTRAE
ncbi:MAG TPA: GNAT family N-acetyltransferase [Solirubrobacterales bacterium]|nr:GNAT family N-acetyltransferase [Solirubrobacterales bacterium]